MSDHLNTMCVLICPCIYYLIIFQSLTLLTSVHPGRAISIWGENIGIYLHFAQKHTITEKIKVVSNRFHKFLNCMGIPHNAVIKEVILPSVDNKMN